MATEELQMKMDAATRKARLPEKESKTVHTTGEPTPLLGHVFSGKEALYGADADADQMFYLRRLGLDLLRRETICGSWLETWLGCAGWQSSQPPAVAARPSLRPFLDNPSSHAGAQRDFGTNSGLAVTLL